jgi:hypothetical protein
MEGAALTGGIGISEGEVGEQEVEKEAEGARAS